MKSADELSGIFRTADLIMSLAEYDRHKPIEVKVLKARGDTEDVSFIPPFGETS